MNQVPDEMTSKLTWKGTVISVQPRIRLQRSFDQRSHTYQGFTLRVMGQIEGKEGTFTLGIGKATQVKHAFRVGDIVQGCCLPVANPDLESAEFYEVSGLRTLQRGGCPKVS